MIRLARSAALAGYDLAFRALGAAVTLVAGDFLDDLERDLEARGESFLAFVEEARALGRIPSAPHA